MNRSLYSEKVNFEVCIERWSSGSKKEKERQNVQYVQKHRELKILGCPDDGGSFFCGNIEYLKEVARNYWEENMFWSS